MNPRSSRWFLRLAVVLVVALLGLFWAIGQRTRSLTIENRSEETIAEVTITLGGEAQTFRDVKNGTQVTAQGPARGEDLFKVEGQLADDKRIRANGRIGDGRDFILLPGGQLQERRKKAQ